MIILRGPKSDIVVPKNYTLEAIGLVTFTIVNMVKGGDELIKQITEKATARFPKASYIVNSTLTVYPMDVDDSTNYNCRITGDAYKLVKA